MIISGVVYLEFKEPGVQVDPSGDISDGARETVMLESVHVNSRSRRTSMACIRCRARKVKVSTPISRMNVFKYFC
jgi:hypothetical protein